MTELESYLCDRDEIAVRQKVSYVNVANRFSKNLGDWVERRLWRGEWRHMRAMGPGMFFEKVNGGGWKLFGNGGEVVTTVSLEELGVAVDRPVKIVATGPSARDYGWDGIDRGSVTLVAVNGAPTFMKEMNLFPDLLVVTDPYFAATGARHFENAQGVPLVTTHRAAGAMASHLPAQLKGRQVSIIERVNSWYGAPILSLDTLLRMNGDGGGPFIMPEPVDKKLKVGWSRRPEIGFFSGCTVAFAALQVVIGLGAKDIEIVGMDLGGARRVYTEGMDARPSSLEEQYEEFILPSFRVMHQALKETDVRVRNVSPTCPLPREIFFQG